MTTRTFFLTLVCFIHTLSQAVADELPALVGDDVFNLQYASQPVISPDGNWVLYTHISAERSTDRFESVLVCLNLKTGESRKTLRKYSITSTPVWHKDSGQYAVSVEKAGSYYIVFMRPGKATPADAITTEVSAKNLTWDPQGKRLIFNGFVKEPQKRLVDVPKEAQSGAWAPPVIEIERAIYRRDGKGYLKHGNHHLFLLDLADKSILKLTDTNLDHTGPFSWSDDHTVYFSGQLYKGWEHQPRNVIIYSVDVVDNKITPVITINGPAKKPSVIHSSGDVAFIGFKDDGASYQQNDIQIYNPVNKTLRNVTQEFDRDITDIQTCKNGFIYFRYNDRGVGKVGYYDPLTKNLQTDIVSDVGGTSIGRPYSGGSFSTSDIGAVSYTLASLGAPSEVAIYANGENETVTNITANLTTTRRIGTVEGFTYSSARDKRKIDGWIVFPPGYDPDSPKKHPLILEIHGGPFANYGARFAMELQLYAAAGYLVVYTNPRGSTSYGEEFAQLINKDYPQQGDFEDLMSAVDYAINHYQADPHRLYVTGGSGGGILTAWIVTKTNRFKAAVSQKPVINWETLAYTSDGYFYFTKYWFDGPPTALPSEYRRRSPLSYVDKVSTPTMLMTGEQDWRTPITEAEQFYQGLKLHGVDTMLVRVPESSHAIAARPSRIWMKLDYVTSWFNRYK